MSNIPIWLNTLFVGGIFYWSGLIYFTIYQRLYDLTAMSEALAIAGGLLIGSSFALSGMSYFFNFLDTKLHYRKQLGLLGFYFALAYAITLVLRFPDHYLNNFFFAMTQPEAILGLGAMSIFASMVIVSNSVVAKMLGSHFRAFLRIGYLAYFLLIIRAMVLEGELWMRWLATLDNLPPPRFLLTIFASYVIILRIMMEISIRMSKATGTSPFSTNPAPSPTTKPVTSQPVVTVAPSGTATAPEVTSAVENSESPPTITIAPPLTNVPSPKLLETQDVEELPDHTSASPTALLEGHVK